MEKLYGIISQVKQKHSTVYLSIFLKLDITIVDTGNARAYTDKLVKSHKWDGTVKSSKCKACEA